MAEKAMRRFWWLDEWQVEEIESWLSEMAGQGWHLLDRGKFFAVFVQGPKRKDRYRCDIFRPNSPQFEERLEFYQAAGWEYVASLGKLHIFRAPNDPAIPELHSDPEEQSFVIAGLVRRLIIHCVILVVAVAVLVLSLLLYHDDLWLEIMVKDNIPHIMMLPIYFFIIFLNARGLILNGRLYSKLRRGRPLARNKQYKGAVRRTKVVAILTFSLFALLFADRLVAVVTLFTAEQYPPIPPGQLPVVRLADLDPEAEMVPVQTPGFDANIVNYYKTDASFWVPRQWYLEEDVTVLGQEWPDGREYSLRLEVQGYQARSQWLARKLSGTLVNLSQSRTLPHRKQIELQEPRHFDELWLKSDAHRSFFIARKDLYVFQVHYSGLEPVDVLLELVGTKIAQLERN